MARDAINLYFEKKCLSYLNRQNADFEEFVAEKDRNSGVAYNDNSSPYLERQVKAFVKTGTQSVVQINPKLT